MSSQRINRNVVASKKPFCKVCFDAGKPESDYTSHHVRSLPDRTGNTKILCPTLLNTECRYCSGVGHTTKFCPTLAAQKKKEERAHKEDERSRRINKESVSQKPKTNQINNNNKFSALMSDDEEEEEIVAPVKKEKEEFPALCEPSKRVTFSSSNSYLNAAVCPAPPVKPQEDVNPAFKVLKKSTNLMFPARRILNWADYDSEDEEADDRAFEESMNRQAIENYEWDD